MGTGRNGKREEDWGERVRDSCYKNPLLFISADSGVRKFPSLFPFFPFSPPLPPLFAPATQATCKTTFCPPSTPLLCKKGRTREGGSLARFTDQKSNLSQTLRISSFYFSFESHNQHLKCRFLSCGKRVSEKQLERGEKNKQDCK